MQERPDFIFVAGQGGVTRSESSILDKLNIKTLKRALFRVVV